MAARIMRPMEIEYALIADYAEVVSGKLYAMGGGWGVSNVPALPAQVRVALAAGIRVGWDETNRAIPVTISVEDDDGRVLVQFEAGVNVGRGANLVPGTSQLAQLAANMSVACEAAGGYRVTVQVDGPGGPVRQIPFRVEQAR